MLSIYYYHAVFGDATAVLDVREVNLRAWCYAETRTQRSRHVTSIERRRPVDLLAGRDEKQKTRLQLLAVRTKDARRCGMLTPVVARRTSAFASSFNCRQMVKTICSQHRAVNRFQLRRLMGFFRYFRTFGCVPVLDRQFPYFAEGDWHV